MASRALSRIVIKISGEALAGEAGSGLDGTLLKDVAAQLIEVAKSGTEVGVVVGAGNFLRGVNLAESGADRVVADHMGMLATVMNALALADAVRGQGGAVRVFSMVPMPALAEDFNAGEARAALARGEIAVFGGGTGNPFFTTDTAAVLKAAEIGAGAVLKATKVDGVYSADPLKDPAAKRFDTISHDEAIERDLKVMDTAAFALARERALPIIVYNLSVRGGIAAVLNGSAPHTRVQ